VRNRIEIEIEKEKPKANPNPTSQPKPTSLPAAQPSARAQQLPRPNTAASASRSPTRFRFPPTGPHSPRLTARARTSARCPRHPPPRVTPQAHTPAPAAARLASPSRPCQAGPSRQRPNLPSFLQPPAAIPARRYRRPSLSGEHAEIPGAAFN